MMKEALLEPNQYYQKILKAEFREQAEKRWEELVRESGVDVEENRCLVSAYKEAHAKTQKLGEKLNRWNVLKVIGFILAGVSVFSLLYAIFGEGLETETRIWTGVISCAVLVGMILLLALKVFKETRKWKKLKNEAKTEEDKKLQNCWESMENLNRRYDSDDTRKLVLKTLPIVSIDPYLDAKRMDLINSRYGEFENSDPNRSTLQLLSGDILGNPYVITKERVHKMGTCDYHGSLTIHWTETERDAKGNLVTRHRSETLTATVTKPKPYYSKTVSLIFASEAAPDLSFSHEHEDIHKLSEKELEKYIKKSSSKLQKKSESSATFQSMDDGDFDALFHALDRDHEVQFRLLFTPLAQKNMIDLMRNSEYGDDFDFYKRKKLNKIIPLHTENWDFDTDPAVFRNFDIDDAKKVFINTNAEYFSHFFYTFAPILSIPLYQQYKSQEFIYKDYYDYNYSNFETELLANRMGEAAFRPEGSATDIILKTAHYSKNQNRDEACVTAYSYRTEERIDYVSKHGGDGHMHDVPVHWIEYIPVEKESYLYVSPENEAKTAEENFYSKPIFAHQLAAWLSERN